MKALLFAGAFNPVSKAHVFLAKYALDQTKREKVIFLPSQSQYIEKEQQKNYALSAEQRLTLLKKCQQYYPWMLISDYDLKQEKQPRTYESLKALKKQGYDCALMMGDDQFFDLETQWLYGKEIAHEFGIVCLERNKNVASMIAKSNFLQSIEAIVKIIKSPRWTKNISSSKIRKWLKNDLQYQKELAKVLPFSLAELKEVL